MNFGGPLGVNSGYVYIKDRACLLNIKKFIYLHKDMRETRTEIRAIYIKLLLPGNVNILTSGTVNFYPGSGQLLGHSDWQNVLSFTKDPRAIPKRP